MCGFKFKMLVVQKGLSAHLNETLTCQVLTSEVSYDDLRLFMHYNLPGEWQQLMMLSCAFLLSPKQKCSTLFIHGGDGHWDELIFTMPSYSLKPFASGEENTGNICWNSLIVLVNVCDLKISHVLIIILEFCFIYRYIIKNNTAYCNAKCINNSSIKYRKCIA